MTTKNIPELFGSLVFNDKVMKERLPKDTYKKLRKAIEQATLLLNEKGISVSEVELKTLIESAVYGLKQGLAKKDAEATLEESK